MTRGGVTEFRHLIGAGTGTVAIYTRRSSGTPATDTYYIHRDHQGSPELVTNSAGAEVTRFSFSAYGARRDSTDWSGPISSGQASLIAGIGRRGYTDHEHLDAVGLVHMNGRVYEPAIGRFLSRDPLLVIASQGINAYSYVHNNPMTLTDPTGLSILLAKRQAEGGGGGTGSSSGGNYVTHGHTVGNDGSRIEEVTWNYSNSRSLAAIVVSSSPIDNPADINNGNDGSGGGAKGGEGQARDESNETKCEAPTQEQRANLMWACNGRYDCIRDVNNFVASFGQSSFIDPMQLGKDFIIESLIWGLGTFTLPGRAVADLYGVTQAAQSRGDGFMVNSGSAALSLLISRSTRGGSERLQRFGAVYSNSVSRGGDAFLFAVQEYQRKNCQQRPGAGK